MHSKRTYSAALVAFAVHAACAAPPRVSTPVGAVASASDASPSGRFDAWVRGYFDMRFRYNPDEATSTGVHSYDAALEDLSPAAIERYGRWLAQCVAELNSLIPSLPAARPDAPPDGSDRPRVDAELLRDSIELERVRLVDWREYARKPSAFHQLAADAIYQLLVRDFAPVDVRVRNATARLRAIPALLRSGEQWLQNPPRLAVEVSLREIAGSIEMIRDVFTRFAARSSNATDRAEAASAAATAVTALEAHREFLLRTVHPRASGDYHDGRARWVVRARLGEGVTETPETIRDAARGEVRRLQTEMRAMSARVARPGEDFAAVLARLRRDHPSAPQLLDAYRREQDEVRAFVRSHELATIDRDRDNLSIEETPGFLRATIFAALSSPGALESVDRRTLFYVTPADLTRPASEIDAYLGEHSIPSIAITSIHEAYPGHHVQGMHQRQAHSLVRRLLWQGSYGEGWAHYVEQMMVDQGFGDEIVRLGQRQDALLRAARAYLDVEVHVFGSSYEDAVRFYRDEAFMSQPGAEMEARRVCLNPASVFVYTYGKFAFYRLRHAVVEVAGGRSMADFHNALLDFGSAPLPILARALFNVELGPWTVGESPSVIRSTAPNSTPAPAAAPRGA